MSVFAWKTHFGQDSSHDEYISVLEANEFSPLLRRITRSNTPSSIQDHCITGSPPSPSGTLSALTHRKRSVVIHMYSIKYTCDQIAQLLRDKAGGTAEASQCADMRGDTHQHSR